MNSNELTKLVLFTLEDNKAIDVAQLDVRELTDVVDNMIICTATSSRHASSMADKVIQAAKAAGVRPLGVEGEKQGEWVLIDLIDVIVHIMQADTREFYSLEKLWSMAETVRNKSVAD